MPRQTAQIFARGAGHTPDRAVAFRVLSGPGVPRCKTGNGRQPFRGVSNFLAPRRQNRRSWVWGCGAAEGIWFGNFQPWLCIPIALPACSWARNRQWMAAPREGSSQKRSWRSWIWGCDAAEGIWLENFRPWLCIPRSAAHAFLDTQQTGSGWQHPVRGHRKSEAGGVGYGAVGRQKVYGSETSSHGSAFP